MRKWMIGISCSIVMLIPPVFLSPITQSSSAQTVAKPQSWIDDILKRILGEEPRDRGDGRPAGRRPFEPICLVTPAQNTKIWHTQPTLVWRGNFNAIGLRLAGKDAELWRHTGVLDQNLLGRDRYTGEPLQPGQTYDWLFFSTIKDKNSRSQFQFQVMPKRDRDPITADLTALEKKLKQQRATQEAIALQRADYFAQRRLWADVLQEVYSVRQPSKELQQVAEKISTDYCQSE